MPYKDPQKAKEDSEYRVKCGRSGIKNHRWTGGRRASWRRWAHKCDRNFESNPLNNSFKDSVGHHLDQSTIINIPKELHKSIRHSVVRNENMEIINQLAWDFLEVSVL